MQEFKGAVKALHAAGIEVILDVVYNHTAEGNHLGPTLSMKGIDNQAYYRVVEDDQRYYMDYTGTGNSLNVRHPHSLQLIMDSLRYWVTEMHVDGFRFDLASTLAREFYDVDRLATFFELVQQDPVVSQVKLIAEPWDIGPGGYQVGGFPPQWSEWNGDYRDIVRDFWRGEPSLGEFASRVAGSSDLYEHSGRRPFASINFVTAHDGFTLRDLVSYNEKHNEANGEDSNDGESHNRSWNHGVEGPTDDPEILAARSREQRNFLATLLLSQGVPMLLHGDELGRTQDGNNNTYAQDSEISWVHWDDVDRPLLEFTTADHQAPPEPPDVPSQALLHRQHGPHRRPRARSGSTTSSGCTPTAARWRRTTGRGGSQVIGMYLNGDGIAGKGSRGEAIHDDHFLLYFNADGPVDLTLPPEEYAAAWDVAINTGGSADAAETLPAGRHLPPRAPQPAGPPGALRARGRARPVGGRVRRRPGRSGPRAEACAVPASTYRLQITADVRPARGGRGCCPTCTTSASTGSTSRRSSRPSPARRTATTSSTRPASTRPAVAPEGLAALSAEARRLGMGVLVDIVPNHVGVATPTPTRGGPTCWSTAGTRRTRRTSTSTGTPGGGRIRTGEDLNYRRFFTIETLAGIRVEDPEVFEATHVEIRRWFDEGLVDGLRVDHPDGLRDPGGYLEDLAALTGGAYVLVEKILEPGRGAAVVVGDRGHHRLRRPRAGRPGAHRPRGGGSR